MRFTVQEKASGAPIASGTEGENVRAFEGNWYFAPELVNMTHLKVTQRTYTCPYKGVCFWIDLETPDGQARNVGWVYHDPLPGYEFIRNQIGFYARDTAGTVAIKSQDVPLEAES